jgi:hypothetical protein
MVEYMNAKPGNRSTSPCCKVGRLEVEYEIGEMDEELVARWRGDGRERRSIRELTETFNKRLLRAALERGDFNYLEGEISNTYQLLTDEEVTEGVKVNIRRALERADVDIDATENDFVSHQTIYNHLTDCLGVSKPETEDSDPVDKSAGEMFSLQNRTVAVVGSKLKRLRGQEALALDEFDVFVDINVFCRACETRHDLGQLLRNGGCTCQLED